MSVGFGGNGFDEHLQIVEWRAVLGGRALDPEATTNRYRA